MKYAICLLVLLLAPGLAPASDDVEITLKHGSDREARMRDQLKEVIGKYDLRKWTFTRTVEIDEKSIPHSHPVLTIHTRHLGDEHGLLACYIHEQIHWYVDANPEQEKATIAALRVLYPNAPKKGPEGARDEYSTYLHLIVCYLEYSGMKELVGAEKAAETLRKNRHYTWIYERILTETEKVAEVVEKNGLAM